MDMFRNEQLGRLARVVNALRLGHTVTSDESEPSDRGHTFRDRLAIGPWCGDTYVNLQIETKTRDGRIMLGAFSPCEWSMNEMMETVALWGQDVIDALPQIDNGPSGVRRPDWFCALVDLDLGEVAIVGGERFRFRAVAGSATGMVIEEMRTRTKDEGRDSDSFDTLCTMADRD